MPHILFAVLTLTSLFASADCPADLATRIASAMVQDITAEVKSSVDLAEFLKSRDQTSVGTHGNLLITLKDGTQWVFKDSGPDGWRKWQGEVGTYNIALFLGIDRVPETKEVIYEGRRGSLQRFLGIAPELGKGALAEVFKKRPQEWNDVQIIQYIAGQWDRHTGNIFVSKDGHIYAIDNEGSLFHIVWQVGDYPYRGRTQVKTEGKFKNLSEFPFDAVTEVPVAKIESIRDLINQFCGTNWGAQLINRHLAKKVPLNYVVYEGFLWIAHPSNLPVVAPAKMRAEQVERLRALNYELLRKILPSVYTDRHIQEILFRRDNLLAWDARLP